MEIGSLQEETTTVLFEYGLVELTHMPIQKQILEIHGYIIQLIELSTDRSLGGARIAPRMCLLKAQMRSTRELCLLRV